MPEMTTYAPGVPCWVDLSADDPVAAKRFYAELLGWEVEEGGPEFGGYSNFHRDGRWLAGVMAKQPEAPMPSAWTLYLATDDAAATVERAREAGATILAEPQAVGSLGSFAAVQDPSGAAIGFWQGGDHPGSRIVNEPGTMVWEELLTRDTEAAKRFYGALLDAEWQPLEGEGMPDMDYSMMVLPSDRERPVGGVMAMPDAIPPEVPSYWHVYFAVEDCDAAVAKVRELGGTVLAEPMDTPYGRMAPVTDPEGATFSVIAMPEGATP